MDRLITVIRLVVVWMLVSISYPVSAQFFNNPLSEAVDNYQFEFLNGSDIGFFKQSLDWNFGGDAARSGDVGDNDFSVMYVQLEGGEEISWDWKVVSEINYDFFVFQVFDQNFNRVDYLTQEITGTVDWVRSSATIPDGPHQVIWAYVKDNLFSVGADAGWVDNVVIEGGASDRAKKIIPGLNFLLE